MFHKEAMRICLGSVVALITLLVVTSQFEKKPYQYAYEPGECAWHIHGEKKEDGTYNRSIYKIIRTIELEGEQYYVADILNWHYDYDHFTPKLTSANYIDEYHPKYTHEEKCRNGIRKDLIEECVADKDWKFSTGGMECPTREEYCKDKDCWEVKK
jgi:hypothetical protein